MNIPRLRWFLWMKNDIEEGRKREWERRKREGERRIERR